LTVSENDKSKYIADSEGAHMDDMMNNDETDVVLAGNIGNDEFSVHNDSLDSSVKVKFGENLYST
jgi:hypothetical protein